MGSKQIDTAYIRDVIESDLDKILALNEEFVEYLSPLDMPELKALISTAHYCRVVVLDEKPTAFMIGFLPGSDYDSDNYSWFSDEYDSFAYIDRIVVDTAAKGMSLGPMLYDDFAAYAKQKGMERLVCEYNVVPMNVGSARFHARYGFSEVERKSFKSGKTVSMQVYALE